MKLLCRLLGHHFQPREVVAVLARREFLLGRSLEDILNLPPACRRCGTEMELI